MRPSFSERLAALVAGSRGRALATLVVTLALGAIAGLFAKGIQIDTNLEALLADNAPSVQALDELRRRQGSTELLNIAVKSSDPAANRRLVEDIHARIVQWPEVVDAFIDLDYTPLRDHALYYVDVSELEDLRDRLEREKQKAIASKMALDDPDVDPDEVTVKGDEWDEDFDDEDLDDEDEAKAPDGASSPPAPAEDEPTSVRDLLQEQRDWIAATGRFRETDLDLIWPQENARGELVWKDQVVKEVASDDGQIMLVRARLTKPPTDLAFASEITDRVDAMFEDLDFESYAPDMLAKVGGAYSASGEAKSILTDLRRATWLSATLVALVLVGGFRSPRSLVIVLVPLAVAVVITVALARLILGGLNVLTAFLFAVLLGIGVDFAVHLYAQREHQGPRADWGAVLRHHLRPLGSSMLTTMGSFLILRLADFKGFKEFGLIAAVGVVVAFVLALVMVPALDRVMGPLRGRRAAPPVEEQLGPPGKPKAPGLRIALLVAVGLIGLVGAPRVRFEDDMRNLRSPKSEAEEGIAYQHALENTQNTGTPVVMLADSREQLAEAIRRLEEAAPTDIVPNTEDRLWIKEIVSLQTNMPADQEAKAPILAEIESITEGFLAELPDLPPSSDARKYQTHLEALERLASAKPLRDEDLPTWARHLFEENDGSIGKIGLLYVNIKGYDLGHVVYVTKRFHELVDDTGVRGASTRFILGDLTIAVEADTRRLPPLTLLVILALIAIDLKRFVPTAITFSSLCLGLWLTFGVMGLWPITIKLLQPRRDAGGRGPGHRREHPSMALAQGRRPVDHEQGGAHLRADHRRRVLGVAHRRPRRAEEHRPARGGRHECVRDRGDPGAGLAPQALRRGRVRARTRPWPTGRPPGPRGELYTDIVFSYLNEAARRALEAEMNLENWKRGGTLAPGAALPGRRLEPCGRPWARSNPTRWPRPDCRSLRRAGRRRCRQHPAPRASRLRPHDPRLARTVAHARRSVSARRPGSTSGAVARRREPAPARRSPLAERIRAARPHARGLPGLAGRGPR